MNTRPKYQTPLILAISGFLLYLTPANVIAATWIGGSGNYGVSTNWDLSDVPCSALETAVIPASSVVVNQDVGGCSVSDLNLGAGATLNLLTGTDYGAITAEIAGTISGSGDLLASTTLFAGSSAYVFGSNGANITLLNATNSASDTRFSAASGAVLDVHVDTVTSTGAANSSVTILSASGAGSMLELPVANVLNAGFNSGTVSVQAHSVTASDGGAIDLSSVTEAIGPADDEDYLNVAVSDTASINLDSLQTVTAGGYVRFNAQAGGTLSLPSLQSTQDGFFVVDDPDTQILANASAWTFSSTGLPNTTTDIIRAVGIGALVDLSGMTELNAGFNSGTLSVQIHQVTASNSGVIDLSSVTQAIGPADDEDYLSFSVSDTASINLDSLQTVTAGGYVRFNAQAGGTLSLPSLQSTQDGFFVVDDPDTQILANASAWTFSSTGLPNTTTDIIRAVGTGALVDLSGMTELNAGFNSGTLSVQIHQVTASNNGVIDLSGVTQIIGPIDDEDHLNIAVSDTASINLDGVQTVNAGGLVRFNAQAGGTLSLPSLQSTQDGFFVVDDPDTQILANASAWTFSSTGLPNTTTDIIRAVGTGALVDLSGMTELNAGFNSGTLSVQIHQVTASNNGVIDLSSVTQAIGPADDEDYLSFSVSDTASINLDSLQTVTAGGYVRFNAQAGGTLSLPSLQSTQDGFFVVDDPDTQILANASAWTFSSTGLPNTTTDIIRAVGTGALVDLSGMTELNAGFNSGTTSVQVHSVTASDGGVIDLSGINSIIGPFDSEDSLALIASTGGSLILGSLDDVTNNRKVFLTADSAATLQFPRSLNADATIIVEALTDSSIAVTGNLTFQHVTETQFNLEVARVSVEGVDPLDIEVGGANTGIVPPDDSNFAIGQLVVGSAEQTTTARLIDVVNNGNGDTCGISSLEREALYLNGFDIGTDTDGLRILNGSTLELAGFDLYANIGGTLTHINSWLTPGVPLPFDEGFIELGTPFDIDMDGVADSVDNCVLEPNSDQVDSDMDGYGNACDGDLNGDLFVNFLDLNDFANAFASTPASPNWNPAADFNNNGAVNFIDFSIMVQMFLAPPGPACPVPVPVSGKPVEHLDHRDVDKLDLEFLKRR